MSRNFKRACGIVSVLHLIVFAAATTVHAEDVPDAVQIDDGIKLEGVLTSKDRHLNVSGLAFSDNRKLLVIASDEGAIIQVLKKGNGDTYRAASERDIPLGSKGEEIDFEGVAWGDKYVYVIGSHSRKRERVKYKEPKPEDNKTVKKNRKRLRTTAIEPPRKRLYRFQLDEHGRADEDSIEMVSLRNLIANDELLRLFQALPSKENGIDIEGIAADGDDKLFIGFRGPVLRGNYVPVIVLEFEEDFKEKDIEYEILFVNLGGRGIRDMIRLKDDEFLVLAGPMGDGPASYRVYRWNGEDCVPGTDEPEALKNAEALCEVPRPSKEAKAEGIAVLDRSDDDYEFLVVFDGVADGGACAYRCER